MNNALRSGNFSSSGIVALLSVGKREMTEIELLNHRKLNPKSKAKMIEDGFGTAALTYIDECNMERRLGRSLDMQTTARPTTWGSFVERRVFNMLGTEYRLCSKDTIPHPTIPFWVGTPDCEKHRAPKTVVDIKCPMTLKSFCQLVDAIYVMGFTGMEAMAYLRENHPDGETYFWQLVSNGILLGAQFAELVIYCPYQSELMDIREETSMHDGDQNPIAWINYAPDEQLPHLPNGGFYRNLNVIRFEIPQQLKDFLTQKVLDAGKLLINPIGNLKIEKEETHA